MSSRPCCLAKFLYIESGLLGGVYCCAEKLGLNICLYCERFQTLTLVKKGPKRLFRHLGLGKNVVINECPSVKMTYKPYPKPFMWSWEPFLSFGSTGRVL